jgi:hypothetical protein
MAASIGGASAASLDMLLVQVQQSSVDSTRETINVAQSKFEALEKASEELKKKMKEHERERSGKQETLDEHLDKGPDLLDTLIFHRHEKETKRMQSDVEMSNAELTKDDAKLDVTREGKSQALEAGKDAIQAGMEQNKDCEHMLEQLAETMQFFNV